MMTKIMRVMNLCTKSHWMNCWVILETTKRNQRKKNRKKGLRRTQVTRASLLQRRVALLIIILLQLIVSPTRTPLKNRFCRSVRLAWSQIMFRITETYSKCTSEKRTISSRRRSRCSQSGWRSTATRLCRSTSRSSGLTIIIHGLSSWRPSCRYLRSKNRKEITMVHQIRSDIL